MSGELRKEIIHKLPQIEGHQNEIDIFEGELKTFIDNVEEKFNKIRDFLDRVDLNNLGNISEAFDTADSMSDKLY